MFGKRNVATVVAEFLGTGILTLLVLSVQRSTIGVPFFIALGAGLTFALLTFAFDVVSGAFFNPALTIAAWLGSLAGLVRGRLRLGLVRTVLYVAAQLLGAWAAYYLYTYYVKSSFQPIGGVFNWHILVAEAVASAIFAFGWFAAVYQGFTNAVRASVSGLSYMIGIVAASSAAIGLLNPALALGTRAWVWGTYVLGPVVGAIVAVLLYGWLFVDGAAVAVAAPAAAKPARTAARRTTARRTTARRSTTTRRRTAARR